MSRTVVMKHKESSLIINFVTVQADVKELSLSQALNCNTLICLFSSTSGKSTEEETEKKKCSLLYTILAVTVTGFKSECKLKKKTTQF